MIGASEILAEQRYGRGLEGLVVGDTAISHIDGLRGHLSYRGYPIEDLVGQASFEEVSYLVLFGQMPDAPQIAEWTKEFGTYDRRPSLRPPARSFPLPPA